MSAPRVLGPGDLDALVALEESAQPLPWTRAQIGEELTHKAARVVGVFDDERGRGLVGYAAFRRAPDGVWLLNLAVAPAARRRGIARRLLEAGIAWAEAEGAEELTLEVRATNEAARALYRSLGFSEVGLRPGYYRPLAAGAPGEDAVLMRLTCASPRTR